MGNNKNEQKTNGGQSSAEMGYATLYGFTEEEIRKMIDSFYGSVVWIKTIRDGKKGSVCYPNGNGEVIIYGK